ncbi:MAG: thioredoxin [Candidatus Mcinerneyibacterium aminivorans]|uniref:Thioredoxin n=1 Tax=Candidatus Mcinerneyibacterium aminivorans TaxID=2703815 RepID=A0A5D0MH18_9BACT|nr:MAG: thioredoxin [Candidatus Mcinerneyibacterium aminivorans]
MSYINIEENNFEEEVLDFEGLVVIDFWAEWCNPCKIFGPLFEEVSKNYKDNERVKFCKVNIDKLKEVSVEYDIMSIPTVMFVKDGEIVHKKVGILEKKDLKELIEKYL